MGRVSVIQMKDGNLQCKSRDEMIQVIEEHDHFAQANFIVNNDPTLLARQHFESTFVDLEHALGRTTVDLFGNENATVDCRTMHKRAARSRQRNNGLKAADTILLIDDSSGGSASSSSIEVVEDDSPGKRHLENQDLSHENHLQEEKVKRMKLKAGPNLFHTISPADLTPKKVLIKKNNLKALHEYQKAIKSGNCDQILDTVEICGFDEFDSQQYHNAFVNINSTTDDK